MTVVPPDTPLTCVGDIMLELITQREMASDYQRTLILDGRETAIGGAVCNVGCRSGSGWNLKVA
jgi:hypothetical protein